MQLRLSNLDYFSTSSRLSYLGLVLAIHGLVAFFSLVSFVPKLQNQQIISVSFVSPSSQEKNSSLDKNSQQNLHLSKAVSGDISSLKKPSPNNQNHQETSKASSKTDGVALENADAKTSAQTEPQFNASYLNNPAPVYPANARRNGVEGKVLLMVLVKENGEPRSVKIARSSGEKILDEAALAAVLEWKFIPATRFGQNIAAEVFVPIEFKII